MKKNKEYYIQKHQELWQKCMEEAESRNADDVELAADSLYNDYATEEHVVGHYLYWYGDSALKIWTENLTSIKKRTKGWAESDTDKAVTKILKRLFK